MSRARSGGRLAALDGLRGVAATTVMIYHLVGRNIILGSGQAAMELFFVLSGFVITRSLLHEVTVHGAVSMRSFYRRRVRRLLPASIVLVAVVLLSARAFTWMEAPGLRGSGLTSLVYVTNWYQIATGTGGGVLDGLWSLSIEEQFYLIWPATFVWLWRRHSRRAVLWAAIAAVVAWLCRLVLAVVLDVSVLRMRNGTETRMMGLLIGAALAFWLCGPTASAAEATLRRWAGPLAWSGIALFGAVCVGVRVYDQRTFVTWWALAPVAAGLVMAAVIADPSQALARALGTRPLVFLGAVSYGTYLWHPLVIEAVGRYLPRGSFAFIVLGAALSVTAGWLSQQLVEQQFVKSPVA